MKAIRLVNGHFDGATERPSAPQPSTLHRKLPHGEWVNAISGEVATHDVYRLTTNQQQEQLYLCEGRTIEKSTWVLMQKAKQSAKTANPETNAKTP